MITKKDKRLGKNIRLYRKKLNLKQKDLAEKIDVTEKYVQYLESGSRKPSLKLLYKIARVLEVKPKDLIDF